MNIRYNLVHFLAWPLFGCGGGVALPPGGREQLAPGKEEKLLYGQLAPWEEVSPEHLQEMTDAEYKEWIQEFMLELDRRGIDIPVMGPRETLSDYHQRLWYWMEHIPEHEFWYALQYLRLIEEKWYQGPTREALIKQLAKTATDVYWQSILFLTGELYSEMASPTAFMEKYGTGDPYVDQALLSAMLDVREWQKLNYGGEPPTSIQDRFVDAWKDAYALGGGIDPVEAGWITLPGRQAGESVSDWYQRTSAGVKEQAMSTIRRHAKMYIDQSERWVVQTLATKGLLAAQGLVFITGIKDVYTPSVNDFMKKYGTGDKAVDVSLRKWTSELHSWEQRHPGLDVPKRIQVGFNKAWHDASNVRAGQVQTQAVKESAKRIADEVSKLPLPDYKVPSYKPTPAGGKGYEGRTPSNETLMITGSRTYEGNPGSARWNKMEKYILKVNPKVIVHGGAGGADIMAERIATKHGIPTQIMRAEWAKFGKKAGYIRNSQMLVARDPSTVGVFYGPSKTSGTTDAAQKATQLGKNVDVVTGSKSWVSGIWWWEDQD